MEKRQFGKTDMLVSILGFGGAEIGFEGTSSATVSELLDSALDAGLNVIDSSSAYLASEELIGKAVSKRRKDFYLFTKCGYTQGFSKPDWSHSGILQQIEDSLKKLQTDYLDLIQLHSCTLTELQKGECITALQQARERGWARYIGYSGDDEAARFAIETGLFDSLQTSISIADQEAIELTLPLARKRGMGVIAKRPIANAVWRTGSQPELAYHHEYWDRIQNLDFDFLRSNPQEAVSTALRFTLSLPGVHTAIVGTTKPHRWRENALLLEAGALPADQIEKIRDRWNEVADETWGGQV